MPKFNFKSYPQILQDMIAKFLADTGVNDINPGSVLTTFLEAAATEDAQQYWNIFQVILNYNIDTTSGTDLENRAIELGLTEGKLEAKKATGEITITDSSFTKVTTPIYVGSRGPVSGHRRRLERRPGSFSDLLGLRHSRREEPF